MAPGGGRGFNCSWEHCDKPFNRKSDLCRHYRTHTNERPYHCTVKNCSKSFIQRSALTVHSRTHTGKKPYVCEHEGCQKAFSDSSGLARHRRIHTGRLPYICPDDICERSCSFCRKTTLAKHQHRSHPPENLTRSPSEDATLGHSYHRQTPVSVSIPRDQYIVSQQPYYPRSLTPNHDLYYPQSVSMGTVPVHEAAPTILLQNVIVKSPINMLHAQLQLQLQYLQYLQMMQQCYDQNPRTNYFLAGYDHTQYTCHQMPPDQMVVSYHPNYVYKSPGPQLLHQADMTD